MKLAVLSDIHGNLDALKAVIKDCQANKIDKYYICGDLAMAGAEPAETIEYLIDFTGSNNVVIIQGNTDEMIAKEGPLPPNEVMAEALKYNISILTSKQKDFLSTLSAQHSEMIGKLSILLVHGSPRKNNEDIMPAQSIEKIRPMLTDVKEDIIFCGHTHLPAGYQVDKQTVVNVGSVGRPLTEDTNPCYVILEIPDLTKKEFEITHHFVEYDKKSASERLAKLPFKGAEKLAGMLLKVETRYP